MKTTLEVLAFLFIVCSIIGGSCLGYQILKMITTEIRLPDAIPAILLGGGVMGWLSLVLIVFLDKLINER